MYDCFMFVYMYIKYLFYFTGFICTVYLYDAEINDITRTLVLVCCVERLWHDNLAYTTQHPTTLTYMVTQGTYVVTQGTHVDLLK